MKTLVLKQQAASLRRIAFVGVALSTTASLVCIIAVPLFYSYLQRVQSSMQQEVDFCKLRSGNIWKEVSRTQVFFKITYLLDNGVKRADG